MITIYNPKMMGDSLLVLLDKHGDDVSFERVGNVTRLYDQDKTYGYHFFDISNMLPSIQDKSGQVFLTEKEIDRLNAMLFDVSFTPLLPVEKQESQIVVGYVEECVDHPDSDHLHITKTNVGDETLQIVCGAPNIAAGQKVVVAKVGSVMPDGMVIWPGELRGVASYGMICSAKELKLPDAPQEKGILVLSDDYQPGTVFKG